MKANYIKMMKMLGYKEVPEATIPTFEAIDQQQEEAKISFETWAKTREWILTRVLRGLNATNGSGNEAAFAMYEEMIHMLNDDDYDPLDEPLQEHDVVVVKIPWGRKATGLTKEEIDFLYSKITRGQGIWPREFADYRSLRQEGDLNYHLIGFVNDDVDNYIDDMILNDNIMEELINRRQPQKDNSYIFPNEEHVSVFLTIRDFEQYEAEQDQQSQKDQLNV